MTIHRYILDLKLCTQLCQIHVQSPRPSSHNVADPTFSSTVTGFLFLYSLSMMNTRPIFAKSSLTLRALTSKPFNTSVLKTRLAIKSLLVADCLGPYMMAAWCLVPALPWAIHFDVASVLVCLARCWVNVSMRYLVQNVTLYDGCDHGSACMSVRGCS